MGSYKRKIVVLLGAILLCSGATLVYSAQSGADDNVESLVNKPVSLSDNQPKLIVGSGGNIDTSGLFSRLIVMILVVVCLGIAAIYLSKKLLPKLNLAGKRIQVSETVHLGPRKAIHLIKIGKQTLLIGSTNENITKLADITDQIPEAGLEGVLTMEYIDGFKPNIGFCYEPILDCEHSDNFICRRHAHNRSAYGKRQNSR
jgi:flagellar biosynthetic protein FliO